MNQRLCKFLFALGMLATVSLWSTMAHAQMPADLAAQLSKNVNQDVIVILKSQHAAAFKGTSEDLQRANAISDEQAPLMNELRQVQAVNIKSYKLVNAIAARVSQGELDRLKANPAVVSVIPDLTIRRPARVEETAKVTKSSASKSIQPNVVSALSLNAIPGACSGSATPLLQPEGLALTNTDSDNPSQLTARSLGIDGTGVKVAWIADGIDINNINFIRIDGTHVFIDYQDFSGDGPGAPTDGGEAFLDSNSIAGQGLQTYNVQNFSVQPAPTPCNIRIEGVAPGASLIGLDVFGLKEDTTVSAFLQAIDYAVETDNVDVLNESFGSNLFPDVTALDAIKQFDEAAVAAGVVVSVSSADAGTTNTIGSPATDPLLIGVGATTQFQFYAQTNFGAARDFATTGWLSNNISALSSSGFDEAGGTITLVAPGDVSWASCTADSTHYYDCYDFTGNPSIVELAGGTSESAPFVSGAAALIIEAYRNTHGGGSPTPAQVKQILTSTASDLGAPAVEQGSGLLNSYQAVLMAEALPGSTATPAGNTILLSSNQLTAAGKPGTNNHWTLTLTNTGANPQTVNLSGRTLGPNQNVQTGTVTLTDGTSPEFISWYGAQENYQTFTFTIPPGVARLDASLAYPPGGGGAAQLSLIDPQGRYAANSLPQGVSHYGNVDVIEPAPGVWTGAIYSALRSDGGVNGTIPWQVATQNFIPFAKVTPSSVKLSAGESKTVTVAAADPSSAGDMDGSIVVTPSLGTATSIPVMLRTLVQPALGGAFSGVLTGGNGRCCGEGQVQYYEFIVPAGVRNVTANLSLTNDASDPVGLYLVSPDGDALGYGQNNLNGAPTLSATAWTLNPTPGVWTLVVDLASPVVGDEVSQPFSGNILFNNVTVKAAGLPQAPGHHLAAGTSYTYEVSVTNNGAQTGYFFIDPRLNSYTTLYLAALDQASGLSLPLTGAAPLWVVPTETSSVSVTATASLPIKFDFGPIAGDPDIASDAGTTATGSYTPAGGRVAQGLWQAIPDEIGPYTTSATPGTASMSMQTTTLAFDSTVSSSTGDLWLAAVNNTTTFSPQVINPGQTATINVTITPEGTSGTVVSGVLYVDVFLNDVAPYGQQSGDELTAIPYEYTIK